MTDVLYKCDYCWRERNYVDDDGVKYCEIHYQKVFEAEPRLTVGEANKRMTETYLSRYGYVGGPVEEHWRNPLRNPHEKEQAALFERMGLHLGISREAFPPKRRDV